MFEIESDDPLFSLVTHLDSYLTWRIQFILYLECLAALILKKVNLTLISEIVIHRECRQSLDLWACKKVHHD